MRTSRRLVFILLAIAVLCAAGPWVLEAIGFSFRGLRDGGVGDMFAGYRRANGIVRVDVILLVQGALVLGLIFGFLPLHRERFTLMLGFTLALAASLAAVQVIPRPLLPSPECNLALDAAAATTRAQLASGLLLLVGVLLVRARAHLPMRTWLVGLAAMTIAFSAANIGMLGRHELSDTQITGARVGLLVIYVAVGLLLSLDLRRPATFAFSLATVAGLLPLAVGQIYLLVATPQGDFSMANVPSIMLWFGNLLPIFGLSVDLARRAAEAEFTRQQAFVRQVLDSLPDLVIARDIDERVALANREAVRFLGVSSGTFESGDLRHLIRDPEVAHWVQESDRRVREGSPQRQTDLEVRDATGRKRWLRVVKKLLHCDAGAPPLVLTVATDVTARKRVETALADRLAIQRTIARTLRVLLRSRRDNFDAHMQEALATVARACRAQFAFVYRNDYENDRVERIYALRDGPMTGKPTFSLAGLNAMLGSMRDGAAITIRGIDDLPIEAAELRDIMGANGAQSALIVPVIRDDHLWGSMGLANAMPGWEWREADETILRALVDIFVGAHARHVTEGQLVDAMHAARASNRAKSEFLANMSHEIRTPLNAVIGLADILQGLDPTSQQQQYLTMVHSAATTLLGVINDVLDFSKIEAGELALDTVAVDLPSQLADLVALMAYPAEQRGLELVYSLAPDLPRQVVADPVRLRQILMNLLNNAIKFTESGVVELAVQFLPGDHEQPDSVRFVVADTGIGIPADKLPLIFEKFTQADASHTRRFGGTGLGLAISKQLVTFMNGTIDVTSEVGVGTTFTVDLPLVIVRHSAPAIEVDPVVQGRRVLVVSRHARVAAAMAAALRALGAEVATAGGAHAYEHALAAQHDLVLLDSHGDSQGAEAFARAWKSLPEAARPPVVVVEPLGDAEHNAQLEHTGYAAVLSKPVEPERLRLTLRNIFAPESNPTVTSETAGLGGDGVAPRILLAEDNLFNQKVASSLLEMLGCVVEVAANGAQAVDAVATRSFDLVLMDCQMPEMDGLEATRRIRALGGDTAMIPVIAMTANAMGEHREACLAAGMDDFASKPINKKVLREIVERWTAPAVAG